MFSYHIKARPSAAVSIRALGRVRRRRHNEIKRAAVKLPQYLATVALDYVYSDLHRRLGFLMFSTLGQCFNFLVCQRVPAGMLSKKSAPAEPGCRMSNGSAGPSPCSAT
jgi:hypothetical protein